MQLSLQVWHLQGRHSPTLCSSRMHLCLAVVCKRALNKAIWRPVLQVQLAFSATGLENKDRFSKSDPFLRVHKLREGGDWVPVLKTEVGGGVLGAGTSNNISAELF